MTHPVSALSRESGAILGMQSRGTPPATSNAMLRVLAGVPANCARAAKSVEWQLG